MGNQIRQNLERKTHRHSANKKLKNQNQSQNRRTNKSGSTDGTSSIRARSSRNLAKISRMIRLNLVKFGLIEQDWSSDKTGGWLVRHRWTFGGQQARIGEICGRVNWKNILGRGHHRSTRLLVFRISTKTTLNQPHVNRKRLQFPQFRLLLLVFITNWLFCQCLVVLNGRG